MRGLRSFNGFYPSSFKISLSTSMSETSCSLLMVALTTLKWLWTVSKERAFSRREASGPGTST